MRIRSCAAWPNECFAFVGVEHIPLGGYPLRLSSVFQDRLSHTKRYEACYIASPQPKLFSLFVRHHDIPFGSLNK